MLPVQLSYMSSHVHMRMIGNNDLDNFLKVVEQLYLHVDMLMLSKLYVRTYPQESIT